MNNIEFKVTIPEGMEIDKENSTFDCVRLKPKTISYMDVLYNLFKIDPGWGLNIFDNPVKIDLEYNEGTNIKATSKKQLKKLLAINKLMNVAKYLNGNWQPNWDDCSEFKYYIAINNSNIRIWFNIDIIDGFVYFKTKELAEQAISILGEDVIRLALCTDW